MQLSVREMKLSEVHLVIDYFYNSTPEYLDIMGVDPSRLLSREAWYAKLEAEFALPLKQRQWFPVIWLLNGGPVGYSSCDRIEFGEKAIMHLHVTRPELRRQGIGAECVCQSVEIYFENFRLKRLYCQPHALNVPPHRTLQKTGFKYVKTYMTVPGPINFHQPVTQWVMDRAAESK
jgi:RimJ/RimL family protein N-acetyltransferase